MEGQDAFFAPLTRFKVIDFTQIGAGPLCGMYLGDLGADVIKVEPPAGDLGRKLGLPWIDDESPMNIAFNRNKRSICIDLKTSAGREVVVKLLAEADVLLESFRPGVMAQFGLDYEGARQINPRLVYCSLSAYGQTGPNAHKPGVDGIIQGTSGLMSLIGTEGAPPSKVQAPVVDVSAGFIATIGTLSRLLERVESGTGGHLDVSLFSSAVALQQSAITTYLGSGELPVRAGSEAPYAAPNEAFETADGWIMIAAYNGNRWEALCTLLGVPQLATDERLALLNTRIENRAYMKDCLSPLFRANTNRHWLEALEAADIICGEVASYEQLVSNPQVAHMKLFTSTTTTRGLTYSSPAFPVNTRAQKSAMAAPACGEHTAEILHSLGYSEAEIAELESHGAVRSMHRPLQPATAA